MDIQDKKINNSNGFTLVETVVTIFIFSIIMLGTTLLMQRMFVNSRQNGIAINNTDQARKIAMGFTNELRNGAYGSNGSYPINQATDTSITFFSTAPLGTGTVSKIRYYISNGVLYKGITNPSGTPLSYNASTEQVTTLLSTLSLGSNPLFSYYDGNYNGGTAALVQPVNINAIKYIRINLILLSQTMQNDTSDTFTITAGAAIRNLKNNLGN